ncbi:MFS transporter [Lysinibacillus sp. NPDC097214]|uniref:MFS transporter n=1 Tax=Lysinibacillus sp. NPDC097214 TaxID=3390584 RepID=UPI003CFC2A44
MAKTKKYMGELSTSEMWASCAIGMGTGLLPFLMNGYMSYFFTDVMLIPASSLVGIMLVARILDGIQDIGIGATLDRIRRPDGQARPFFKWFAIPFFIFSALLFLNPPFGETGKVIYAAVTYIGALFMLSFLQLPYATQISLITKDSKVISKLSSMRFITASIVSVIAGLAVIPLLEGFGGGDINKGFFPVGIIVGVLGAASAIWAYFGTRDRYIAILPKKEKIPLFGQLRYLKNFPWLLGLIITLSIMFSYTFSSAMAIYYFTHVIPNQTFAGLALVVIFAFMVPGSAISPIIGGKMGKKRAIMIGVGISICGKLIMLLGSSIFIFIGLGMTGFGLGIAIPLLTALMPDIVDYGEWKHHASTPGILYSAISLGSKMGMGLAVSVQLAILSKFGYDATLAVQPDSAINAISLSYIFVPLVCEALALIAISLYRIDHIRDQIQNDLTERYESLGLKRVKESL